MYERFYALLCFLFGFMLWALLSFIIALREEIEGV